MAGTPQGGERRLLSARAAREALAEGNRARLEIVQAAEFGARFASEFTTYFSELSVWYERVAVILAQLPPPPAVPKATASALSQSGSPWAGIFSSGEQLVAARELVLQAASLAPKAVELFDESAGGEQRDGDIRWRVGGVFALLVASQHALELGPSDLAMVGVASGIDEPLDPSDFDGDEALRHEYSKRCDKWRKRLAGIRPLVAALRGVVPTVSAPTGI